MLLLLVPWLVCFGHYGRASGRVGWRRGPIDVTREQKNPAVPRSVIRDGPVANPKDRSWRFWLIPCLNCSYAAALLYEKSMSDFLLVHGGSHGAWCWEGVIRELNRLGNEGHALDLPGGGHDSTPRASITFNSYVVAVNSFVHEKDLQDLVLVGHSLAGIILPDVVAANRERVREVVFIAAYVLDRGERAIDVVASDRTPEYYRLAEASPEHSLMLAYHTARQRFFSDLSDAAARTAYAKLTPQPLAPYLEPARHGARSISSISRYIICRNDQNLPFDVCLRFAVKLGWVIQDIKAGHDVMLSKPKELVALLTQGIAEPG